MFNFDTKKTSVLQALKIWSFPLCKYAEILSQLFLYLFIILLLVTSFSLFNSVPDITLLKISVFFLICCILFWETSLFLNLKIKKPEITLSLPDTASDPERHNIAELLSLQACQIVEKSITVCKKRKLSEVNSQVLFYAALIINKDIQNLIFRLGINVKELQADLKNYLEKSRPQSANKVEDSQKGRNDQKFPTRLEQQPFTLLFSKSFQETIIQAMNVANERGRAVIGEKELLVALAREDAFFKKILIKQDLKEKDVENITLWLDAVEEKMEQSKKFWTQENLSRAGSLGRDFASGFTVTLDQFSIDWRDIISKHIFLEIVGHKKEINEVEVVLAKSSLSNVLIVGDAGVGRKSIVHALAQRCYLGASLPELNNKRVVELDMISLLARIQSQEKLEITLDQIFQEVFISGNVILVIDKLDDYIGQKAQKPGMADVSSILGKYLPLPNFHFIGITSYDGLHRNIEQNSAFLEYFRKVEVSEVSELETIKILQNVSLGMEQKYNILIIYPTIREIVNLTSRYFPSTPFPKKAIDVLDEAVAYVKSLKEKVVLPHHIASVISDKTQIPVGKMEFKEKSVLLNLENLIHQKIINQEEAVSQISIAMRRARSGISSKKRPMGVFLFLGPTGVGKTETAKALAEIYFGRVEKGSQDSQVEFPEPKEKMIRLDMSEFQSVSDIPRLLGATSPVEQQGMLTTPVRENPFSLILLDEIEKAHPHILNLFLQVFDEGHITDGQGRKIIFNNTIIICTSNAGAEVIFREVASGNTIEKNTLLDFLFQKKIFRPEFINRFDAAVIFYPLTKDNLMDISKLMFDNLVKILKEKDINFIVTDSLKEKMVELSYKPEFGAREMRRVFQEKIENKIAEALLSDNIAKGDSIEMNPENFEIHPVK